MRVLVLEDSIDRITEFKERFKDIPAIVVYVDTVDGFIQELEKNPFPDLFFLDHDLGGLAYVPVDDPNTGSAAVKHLTENFTAADFKYPVLLHSANPAGRDNMYSLFQDERIHAVKTPYVWLKSEFSKYIKIQ